MGSSSTQMYLAHCNILKLLSRGTFISCEQPAVPIMRYLWAAARVRSPRQRADRSVAIYSLPSAKCAVTPTPCVSTLTFALRFHCLHNKQLSLISRFSRDYPILLLQIQLRHSVIQAYCHICISISLFTQQKTILCCPD